MAQSAALAPQREIPSLIPSSCNHPTDLYLPVWKCRKPAAFDITVLYLPVWKCRKLAALDITVIFRLQQLTLANAAAIRGSALLVAEERKCAAYADSCAVVRISFSPLAVETTGGWIEEAAETIRCTGRFQGL